MISYYITMSMEQARKHGLKSKGHVAVILPDAAYSSESDLKARALIKALYGTTWAFMYQYAGDLHPADCTLLSSIIITNT